MILIFEKKKGNAKKRKERKQLDLQW